MNPKTIALGLATMATVGCTPTRLAVRRDDHSVLPPLGQTASATGQIIAPKRCDLRLAVLSRPLNDEAINQKIWCVTDEQVVSSEARQTLEANGLRVGLITGNLPPEVDAVLHAPPPNKVDPSIINIPSGDSSLFCVCPGASAVSLILNRPNGAIGKDFTDAKGMVRVTATHDGPSGVALRLVPEIHHGPMQHRYAADASTNPFAVAEFVRKVGQQEDSLRELATTLSLQPGQLAVVGCQPGRSKSLGHFLLTETEANSDRILQKVLLIWASQGTSEGGMPSTTLPDTPVRRGPTDIARTPDQKAGTDAAAESANQNANRPL